MLPYIMYVQKLHKLMLKDITGLAAEVYLSTAFQTFNIFVPFSFEIYMFVKIYFSLGFYSQGMLHQQNNL